MKPDRLNALTDGVVAIVLTIMVLEVEGPGGGERFGGARGPSAPRRLPARLHLCRHLL
jgi:uncharacterized membrane protein